MPIDDEPRSLCDFVVDTLCDVVGFMRLPIHTRKLRLCSDAIDLFDKGGCNTASSRGLHREQVLQVADIRDGGGAAMVEKVCKADDRAIERCHQRIHGLRGGEKSLPRVPCDLGIQGCWTRAPVEGVIAFP